MARVLHDGQWSALSEAVIQVASSLRVTELMYNPPGSDDAEYIELRNVGRAALDLTGMKLVRNANGEGIEYDFGVDGAKTALRPGEFLVIAKDPEVFRETYPTASPAILAERPFVGRLSNSGETIRLVDSFGARDSGILL